MKFGIFPTGCVTTKSRRTAMTKIWQKSSPPIGSVTARPGQRAYGIVVARRRTACRTDDRQGGGRHLADQARTGGAIIAVFHSARHRGQRGDVRPPPARPLSVRLRFRRAIPAQHGTARPDQRHAPPADDGIDRVRAEGLDGDRTVRLARQILAGQRDRLYPRCSRTLIRRSPSRRGSRR